MPEELGGKQRRRELWAEVLRDIGILVLVFAPLDIVLARSDWSGVLLSAIVSAAIALIAFGVHQDPRSRAK
jgi:hypothetical protein